jgi:integrase/recombinase XerC/integrase/recombinase XerD
MIDTDPSLGIEYPRLKSSKVIPLTQEQIKQIVDAATNDRDYLIVELFHYTGIRRSELIEIKVSDINFTKRLILIRGKGGKERFVPFNNKLQRMLRNYIDKNNITERLIDLQPRHVNNIFQKISRRIRHKVHPHMLRHAYASELYRKTKDILLIKKLLGHSNVATTSRYLESLAALNEQDMESYRKVFG